MKPGDVVNFAFLFRHQAHAGVEYGKDRPCVILDVRTGDEGRQSIELAPISTGVADAHKRAVPVPADVARRLGLDERRQSSVVLDEANRIKLPCRELVPVRAGDGRPEQPLFGAVPADLLRRVQEGQRELRDGGQCVVVDRDDLKAQREAQRGESRPIQASRGKGMEREFERERE